MQFSLFVFVIILMTTRKSGRDWYLALLLEVEDPGRMMMMEMIIIDCYWYLLSSPLGGGCWLCCAGGEFWSDLIWSSVIYQRDLDLAWLTNILESSISAITTSTTRQSGQICGIVRWSEHSITWYFSLTFIILTLKTESIKIPEPFRCISNLRSIYVSNLK